MDHSLSKRGFLLGCCALGAVALGGRPAAAFTLAEAHSLVDALVGEITQIINSGRSERAMYADFERVFVRYADVTTIARSVLGPAARRASAAQMRAYTEAFQGYLARKYGKRFRDFIGGRIEVTDARPVRNYYEVISTAYLPGDPPFEVRWLVSNRSGKNLFFNILIEGVNMLATERTEIGAMLDRHRGDIDALTADLRRAG